MGPLHVACKAPPVGSTFFLHRFVAMGLKFNHVEKERVTTYDGHRDMINQVQKSTKIHLFQGVQKLAEDLLSPESFWVPAAWWIPPR